MTEWLLQNNWIPFVVLTLCLFGSAFFSASETAITSLGVLKSKHLVNSKIPGYKFLNLWLERPNRVLTTILILNNAINIFASAIATALAANMFENNAIGIATGSMTFMIVTFGEIVPKSYAKSRNQLIAMISLRVIAFFYYLMYPMVWVFSEFADFIIKAAGSDPNVIPTVTEDELEFLVEHSESNGSLEKIKRKMLAGVFDFDDIRVREVMTPRIDMVAIDAKQSFDDVIAIINESGYSRIPVYYDSIDNIIGVVLAKDLMKCVLDKSWQEEFNVKKVMRKVQFVPESNFINDVFKDLQKSKNHVAVVIDEHGGTSGIISLEDILETIVGEIQDEYDEEEQKFRKIGDDIFHVSGSVTVDEFIDFFKIDEETLEDKPEDDVDTIAGWLTKLIQDMPKIGQTVLISDLKIEVTKLDRHRIEDLRVTRVLSSAESDMTEKKEDLHPSN